jgi:hypothetical protein
MTEEAVPGSGDGSSAQLSTKGAHDLNTGSSAQVTKEDAPSTNSSSSAQAGKKDTQDPKNGLAAQVVGNASLVTAALVYMGWAYEAALLGYFHISALSFNLSVLQYVLKSTPFFFHPAIILGAVIVVIIIVVVGPVLGRFLRLPKASGISRILRSDLAMGLGLLIVAGLVWFGLRRNGLGSWFSVHTGFFYVAVALIGVGSLLLTWPNRARHGLFSFALAIVIAAVCTLWIAGLYASSLGTTAAEAFASSLTTKTAVTVYSIEALALSGPGVTCQSLPAGSLYHYRYEGLRLLYVDSGTYYLLPVNWASQQDPTYILTDSDQIRIELSSSNVALGTGRTGCKSGLPDRRLSDTRSWTCPASTRRPRLPPQRNVSTLGC